MPEKRAWASVVDEVLNHRPPKPRSGGLTMVMDNGVGVAQTGDVLQISGDYIDHWKCGFGTSALVSESVLREKLGVLREQEVLTYPGGTLLEVALLQRRCRPYITRARELGFTAIEVSDGTITLPAHRRRNIINFTLDAGLVAITEVGKKDSRWQPSPVGMAEQALRDLESGASWVILEGRESGRGVGIYDANGTVRCEVLEKFCEVMDTQIARVIWEAPLQEQQASLIERFGPDVNLGNIPSHAVLALEALRAGWRFDTMRGKVADLVRSGRWDCNRIEDSQLK